MNRVLTFVLAVFAFAVISTPPAVADTVEATVKDEKGNVLFDEVILESDIPALLEFIMDEKYEAGQAQEIIPKFGHKAVPYIIDSLKDGRGRYFLLVLLAKVADERALVPAADYLNDPDTRVRGGAASVLSKLGEQAVPEVLTRLGDEMRHETALWYLKYAGLSDESLDLVISKLSSDNPLMRSGAALLLGSYNVQKAEPDIIRLMDDPDTGVRKSAFEAYRVMNRGRYDIDVLSKGLRDGDASVRAIAAKTLKDIDDERVEPVMLGVLETDKDHDVLMWAMTYLMERHVDAAIFPIMKLFDVTDPDAGFQATVADALGELGAKEAVPYMVEPYEKGIQVSPMITHEVMDSLAKLGVPVDLGLFLKYLEPGVPEDTNTEVALDLIEAQAKPGDDAVIKALEDFRKLDGAVYYEERIDRILDRIQG